MAVRTNSFARSGEMPSTPRRTSARVRDLLQLPHACCRRNRRQSEKRPGEQYVLQRKGRSGVSIRSNLFLFQVLVLPPPHSRQRLPLHFLQNEGQAPSPLMRVETFFPSPLPPMLPEIRSLPEPVLSTSPLSSFSFVDLTHNLVAVPFFFLLSFCAPILCHILTLQRLHEISLKLQRQTGGVLSAEQPTLQSGGA